MKEMGSALARCVCIGQNSNDEKIGSVYFTFPSEKDPIRIPMPIELAREFRVSCDYRIVISVAPNPDAPKMN